MKQQTSFLLDGLRSAIRGVPSRRDENPRVWAAWCIGMGRSSETSQYPLFKHEVAMFFNGICRFHIHKWGASSSFRLTTWFISGILVPWWLWKDR